MQKLSGKSIDKFYKSCLLFHQESNKIEFAFFLIFSWFSTDLQVSAKHKHYLRTAIHRGPWTFSAFIDMPLLHRHNPGKMATYAMWSSGSWVARPAQFRRAPAARSAGSRRWVARGSPMLDSFARTRRKEDRQRPTGAHPSGGRGGMPSGEGWCRVGR
jgi:hypothetical protein